jgi:hypothetical protein
MIRSTEEEEERERPNAMHRAVHFLLEQTAQNNPDVKRTAERHMAKLHEMFHKKDVEPAPAAPVSERFAPRNRSKKNSPTGAAAASPAADTSKGE